MLLKSLLPRLMGVALLGISGSALAQSAASASTNARYIAAHDSLMRRVASARAQAEVRMNFFTAKAGSFGGLHRKVKSYAGVGSFLVKQEVVRQRFGVELIKTVYYDTYSRKVLTERYEGQHLVRLELWEYPAALGDVTTDQWLLVRGDYLQHGKQTARPATSLTGEKTSAVAKQQASYFFRSRPVGEK